MNDKLLTLLLKAYWKGRSYEEHRGLFGKESADRKKELYNGIKAEAYFKSELQKLKL